jgi:hypothetical protein
MALAWTNFGSFAEVEAYYNKIKPIISSRFTREHDIRPIGDRRRFYERIVRVSTNSYALADWYTGGPTRDFAYGVDATPEEIIMLAPILWERHADGTETVRIRNATHSFATCRYLFLGRHTPAKMLFQQTRMGVQFIKVGSSKHVLPQHKSTPRALYVQRKDKTGLVCGCDGRYLVFRRDATKPDLWVHTYGEFAARSPSKPYVDRELKAEHKRDVEEFYTWACAILPMFGKGRDWGVENGLIREAHEYMKDLRVHPPWRPLWNHPLPAPIARTVLADPDHPLRMFALHQMRLRCDWITDIETEADQKRFRAQFMRWVNRFASFHKED